MEQDMKQLLEAFQARQAEMEAKMEALQADLERYKSECQRYRNECRSAAGVSRNMAALAGLTEQKRAWVTDGVPTPPQPFDVYDAGENAYLIYRDRSNKADYLEYCTVLTASGYQMHASNQDGTASFATYANDRAVISVSFSTHDNILRAVVEPAADTAFVPKLISDGVEGCAAPAFVQMNDHMFDVVDCGMSYIFRLSDGTFILIDGGWDTEAIADALYEKLVSLSEGRDIVISAWYFTHAHIDHIGAIYRVAQKYGDKITLKRVIFNYPGESRMTEMGDEFVRGYVRRWRTMLKSFGDVEIIKARTGQRFRFPDLSLDMLFTYEDYKMPRPLRTFNDTSLVFRVKTMGETYIFLGDASVDMCGILVAKYGNE